MNGFSTFKCLLSAAVLLAICVPADAPLYGADRPITIGVVIDEATRGEREPLRDYLTKAMGRPVNLASPDTYRETARNFGDPGANVSASGLGLIVRTATPPTSAYGSFQGSAVSGRVMVLTGRFNF